MKNTPNGSGIAIAAKSRSVATSAMTMPWPCISGLNAALQKLNATSWDRGRETTTQKAWIKTFHALQGSADSFSASELSAICARTASELNEFMELQGFPEVNLDEFTQSSPCIGVAGVQRVGINWLHQGMRCNVAEFQAVQLRNGIGFWKVRGESEVVVQVATASGDTVFVKMENDTATELNLWEQGSRLFNLVRKERMETCSLCSEVRIPFVSHGQLEEISALEGCITHGGPNGNWHLAKVVQQVRFSFDESGATASNRGQAIPRVLNIDRPFLVWVDRKSLPAPLMVGRFCQDSWKLVS